MKRAQTGSFFRNRKARRERILRKMANMRAAKERLRQQRAAAGLLEREPKFERWFPLQLGLRDKTSREVAWTDLRSIRDAAKRIAVVLRFYVPRKSR